MEGIKVLSYTRWYPLRALGLTNPLGAIHAQTVITTWIILALLLVALLMLRYLLARHHELLQFLVTSLVRSVIEICDQTLGFFNFGHVCFVTALFLFILLCNTITVFIPWLEEPTSDINTPLAMGIISFLYIQVVSIQTHGIKGYLNEYLSPFFMFPLHVTGKLASIISISFRLFGNIFGGAIITAIYNSMKMGSIIVETLLLVTGTNMLVTLFFGVFEGLIQAFVFFMLTLTYLAIGIQSHEPEDNFS